MCLTVNSNVVKVVIGELRLPDTLVWAGEGEVTETAPPGGSYGPWEGKSQLPAAGSDHP